MAANIKKFGQDRMKELDKSFRKKPYYEKKNFSPANTNISPSQKDTKEYMMSWVNQIYSLFLKKKTWMGGDYNDIDIMRRFMEGNQPVDQYRDFLYGKSDKTTTSAIDASGFDRGGTQQSTEADRMAWVNIDEKPISIGPKIVTKLLEQARSMYYEMSVNAVDSMSVHTEEMSKARLWFEKENQEWVKAQRAAIGLMQKEPDFMPLNSTENELYAMSGGFKVPYSVNMEQLLKHTFKISEWDKEVREKLLKDLISIGYGLIREYYDAEDKRIKVKYVDPRFGGMQYSRDNSFKDSEYAYELEEWPISKVRQKFDLTYEEAASLAYSYSGAYGNPATASWNSYGSYDDTTGSLGFDFYRVPAFRCEFIDIDNERYYKHVTKKGKTFNKPLKNKSPEGLEVFDNKIRYVREATWIPGTNYFTDFGKVKYMPRMNPKKPSLSYKGVKLGVPALFQQIKPLLNGLNLAWWKTQQAISIAISNGIAVDVGALKNIAIGKDKSWDVTRVLQYYRQQAILLHKKSNPMNLGSGGSSSPVSPLVTRMHENIAAQFDIMDRFMRLIESISGINLVSTGDTPAPRTGKFNMQVALEGTNQIIGSIIRASTELQSDVSSNVVYRIRGLTRMNKSVRDSYINVIGKAKMKTIMLAEKSNVDYGISIEARDISEMKLFIEEVLGASIKASSGEGGGLLDASEVILIRDMMDQRQNMRMISLTLGYMLRKKGKEREMQKMQAIEAQGKQNQELLAQQEQGKQQERVFEMAKIQKEFESDYAVKWQVYPQEAMRRAMATPPGQAVPGQQGQMPPQETPMEAPPAPQQVPQV
jgi:hypothetical protein